ncbi:MAG: co-chaperone DjlA [Marinicellaceae bacterium]
MIGALIGAIIGFKAGSVIGMILLGYFGYSVDTWIAENILGRPSHKAKIQESYFEALFTSIGKLAKADGTVSAQEIQKCELIMQNMQLNSVQRKSAIQFFNKGKQSNSNINPVIDKFNRATGRSFSVKQMFLEMLIEVAIAEGSINQAEWNLLEDICTRIRFPQQLLVALVKMRGFNIKGQKSQSNSQRQGNQYRQKQRQWQPPKQHKVNSYEVLGVSPSDSKTVIRRAYKKLMSSHHPDKLIAKGLPPEMVEIAKKKTQSIQAAWEDVKELRGF